MRQKARRTRMRLPARMATIDKLVALWNEIADNPNYQRASRKGRLLYAGKGQCGSYIPNMCHCTWKDQLGRTIAVKQNAGSAQAGVLRVTIDSSQDISKLGQPTIPSTSVFPGDQCDKPLAPRDLGGGWKLSNVETQAKLWVPNAKDATMLKIFRVLKIFRLVRLMNLKILEELEDMAHISNAFVRLIKVVLAFGLTLHLSACAYWLMARQQCMGAYTGTRYDSDGSVLEEATQRMPAFCPTIENLDDDKLFNARYAQAFEFSLMVMIGNTSNRQDTTVSIWFTIVMLIFGLLCFSSILGAVTTLQSEMAQKTAAEEEEVNTMTRYLDARNVSNHVIRDVIGYVRYQYQTGNTRVNRDMFDDLPPQLKSALNLQLKARLINKANFLGGCGADIVVDVTKRLVTEVAMPGQIMTHKNRIAEAMYFVVAGRLSAMIPVLDAAYQIVGQQSLFSYSSGSHFGEMALFGLRTSLGTVRAEIYCELERLDAQDFDALMLEHEKLRTI
eukprot:g4192.t1